MIRSSMLNISPEIGTNRWHEHVSIREANVFFFMQMYFDTVHAVLRMVAADVCHHSTQLDSIRSRHESSNLS